MGENAAGRPGQWWGSLTLTTKKREESKPGGVRVAGGGGRFGENLEDKVGVSTGTEVCNMKHGEAVSHAARDAKKIFTFLCQSFGRNKLLQYIF